MDWVVFGDDWGRHPSTTQHLVANLPPEDRIVWVDSIGMHTPGLNVVDVRRALGKLAAMVGSPASNGLQDRPAPPHHRFRVVRPLVLPVHQRRLGVAFNRRTIGRRVRAEMDKLGMREPMMLLSNPVAYLYAAGIPHARLAYLKLDEYTRFPGVEPGLVAPVEDALLQQADVFCATARGLLTNGHSGGHYLPQGVDVDLFASVPLTPPEGKTLGFFGIVGEWLDYPLIEKVVLACPDWTFEFLGPVHTQPGRLPELPNVRFRDAVPHSRLPVAVRHWSAAWLPFVINEHILACNPIALREYLAAGLPAATTTFPEAQALSEHVTLVDRCEDVVAWLTRTVPADDEHRRAARKEAMQRETWTNRAAELRTLLAAA
jgi:hypothetical protein